MAEETQKSSPKVVAAKKTVTMDDVKFNESNMLLFFLVIIKFFFQKYIY